MTGDYGDPSHNVTLFEYNDCDLLQGRSGYVLCICVSKLAGGLGDDNDS